MLFHCECTILVFYTTEAFGWYRFRSDHGLQSIRIIILWNFVENLRESNRQSGISEMSSGGNFNIIIKETPAS